MTFISIIPRTLIVTLRSFSFFLLLNIGFNAYATTVLPISLEQLSQQAETIFHAKVLKNRIQKDSTSGQVVTYTDFEIIESIKGNSAQFQTIKQLGGQLNDSPYRLHVYGVPQFTPGKEVVVFLPEVSRLGFCSPLGLHQGHFNIRDINGEKVISNGRSYRTANVQNRQAGIVRTSESPVSLPLASNPDKPEQAQLSDFIYSIRAFSTK